MTWFPHVKNIQFRITQIGRGTEKRDVHVPSNSMYWKKEGD